MACAGAGQAGRACPRPTVPALKDPSRLLEVAGPLAATAPTLEVPICSMEMCPLIPEVALLLLNCAYSVVAPLAGDPGGLGGARGL